MKPRLVPRVQGSYIAAEYKGNGSGAFPIGKKVLILTDEFKGTFAGDKLEFLPQHVEAMNQGAESGVIVAIGESAFSHHADHTRWDGPDGKPEPGDHVYFEKYAGLLIMGNDGKMYRLMDDSSIGAIYHLGGEDTNAPSVIIPHETIRER